MVRILAYPGNAEFKAFLQKTINHCNRKWEYERDLTASERGIYVKSILDTFEKSGLEFFMVEYNDEIVDFIPVYYEYGLLGFDLRFFNLSLISEVTEALSAYEGSFIKVFYDAEPHISSKFQPPECTLPDGTHFSVACYPEMTFICGDNTLLAQAFEKQYISLKKDEPIRISEFSPEAMESFVKSMYSCPSETLLWTRTDTISSDKWSISNIPGFKKLGREHFNQSYYRDIQFVAAYTSNRILSAAKIRTYDGYNKGQLVVDYVETSAFYETKDFAEKVVDFIAEKYGDRIIHLRLNSCNFEAIKTLFNQRMPLTTIVIDSN